MNGELNKSDSNPVSNEDRKKNEQAKIHSKQPPKKTARIEKIPPFTKKSSSAVFHTRKLNVSEVIFDSKSLTLCIKLLNYFVLF